MTDGITLDSRGAEAVRDAAEQVIAAVGTVIDGKDDVIRSAFAVMLAGGHLLIEDVPGVGKTMLANALARATGGTISRIQFTPDLLPSDVTGASVFDQSNARFEFKPGAVFANIVLADEINRASPKTQAALLECMEEGQVTVDGASWPLPDPSSSSRRRTRSTWRAPTCCPRRSGTASWPASPWGTPTRARSATCSAPTGARTRSTGCRRCCRPPVSPSSPRRRGTSTCRRRSRPTCSASSARPGTTPEIRLGASPRASLQLLRAAKATALIDGRDFVLPDDIDALAADVLAHRLVLRRAGIDAREGQAAAATRIVRQVVAATPVPLQ